MDAARAAMGQGWPFAACPWSNDGAREPDEVGPDARGKTSWLLLGRLPEVTRRKGGTGIGNNVEAAGSRRKKMGQIYFLRITSLRRYSGLSTTLKRFADSGESSQRYQSLKIWLKPPIALRKETLRSTCSSRTTDAIRAL